MRRKEEEEEEEKIRGSWGNPLSQHILNFNDSNIRRQQLDKRKKLKCGEENIFTRQLVISSYSISLLIQSLAKADSGSSESQIHLGMWGTSPDGGPPGCHD